MYSQLNQHRHLTSHAGFSVPTGTDAAEVILLNDVETGYDNNNRTGLSIFARQLQLDVALEATREHTVNVRFMIIRSKLSEAILDGTTLFGDVTGFGTEILPLSPTVETQVEIMDDFILSIKPFVTYATHGNIAPVTGGLINSVRHLSRGTAYGSSVINLNEYIRFIPDDHPVLLVYPLTRFYLVCYSPSSGGALTKAHYTSQFIFDDASEDQIGPIALNDNENGGEY